MHLAGVMEPDPELADAPGVWERAIADNLANAYAFATAMEDRLPPGRMGRLVFASSVAFRRGAGDHVAYSAAKGGLVGLTRALARRLRRRATVNAVAPGVIMTDMSVPLIAQAKDRLLAEIPLGRFGAPEEVAPLAIRLLRENGIVTEAQFITGIDSETPETINETYKMVMDWGADMANWSMFTPWPYSDLYREMEDKVEVLDFEKYNFVTPIMKPKNMERGELLDAVMNNYRRFYMRRSLFHYPWIRDPVRRRYLLGCLKAFLKSAYERKFYDLGKFGYWGPQTIKKLKWYVDASRKLDEKVDFGDVAAATSR